MEDLFLRLIPNAPTQPASHDEEEGLYGRVRIETAKAVLLDQACDLADVIEFFVVAEFSLKYQHLCFEPGRSIAQAFDELQNEDQFESEEESQNYYDAVDVLFAGHRLLFVDEELPNYFIARIDATRAEISCGNDDGSYSVHYFNMDNFIQQVSEEIYRVLDEQP